MTSDPSCHPSQLLSGNYVAINKQMATQYCVFFCMYLVNITSIDCPFFNYNIRETSKAILMPILMLAHLYLYSHQSPVLKQSRACNGW